MAEWYVYQDDGSHLGPLSTEAIVDAILTGKFSPEIWVAAPSGARWLRALDVPVISELIDGVPTRQRRPSGLRIVPGGFTPGSGGTPVFGSTVMMIDEREVDLASPDVTTPDAPPTERDFAQRGPDGFPVPPSSSSPSSPYGGGETLESPGAAPRKRSQGAR